MALKLEKPEGTMNPGSPFYVERDSDKIAIESIREDGVTITIKGPRQMGKSSLLLRTREQALREGKRVVVLDFQLFEKISLVSSDTFFRQFCDWLSEELDLESRVAEYWEAPIGNSRRTTRYLQRYILNEVREPLVIAMDEVDTIFDTPFQSDFFGMLRSWHNSRELKPLWKRLDLVLVTSTEPYQLVDNLNQSPFNVGEVIELRDFTPEQVTELNRRHANPLNQAELSQLMALLGGQPYLVRRALYLVASGRISSSALFNEAIQDRGPFGDHLRNLLFRLHSRPELIEGLNEVISSHGCRDEKIFFRLRGAGLVKREGRAVVPRCQLYAAYFRSTSFNDAINHQSPALETAANTNPQPFEKAVIRPVSDDGLSTLSARELEVLKLVAQGLSNPQVAERLNLSAHTVNSHLTTVYSKLRVSSRVEAVRFALEHKLV